MGGQVFTPTKALIEAVGLLDEACTLLDWNNEDPKLVDDMKEFLSQPYIRNIRKVV